MAIIRWVLTTVLLSASVAMAVGFQLGISQLWSSDSDISSEDDSRKLPENLPKKDLNKMKSIIDSMTEDMLKAAVAAQGVVKDGRVKRETYSMSSPLQDKYLSDETGAFRLNSVDPLFPLCDHPLDIKTTVLKNRTYCVCVSANSKVTLGLILADKWQPLTHWEVPDPREAVIFASKGLIYIMVTDASQENGANLLRYRENTGEVIDYHTTNSKYPNHISLWRMKMDKNNYHLSIANTGGPSSGSVQQEIFIYEWRDTYFDRYSIIKGSDVRDMEPFHIDSNAFLAVANHKDSSGNYHIDSEIFHYHLDEKKWESYQRFRTYGASDMQYFSLGRGRRKEHFLAVANQFEFVSGQFKHDVNSVIYKWVNRRFVPFQCITTTGATKISALQGRQGEFLLAIASLLDSVLLYQYNGWNFVLSSVQYTRGSMGPGALSAGFHYVPSPGRSETRPILIVSNPSINLDVNTFGLGFVHENTMSSWYHESLGWCRAASRRVNRTLTSDLLARVDGAYLVDQLEPIHIKGEMVFQNNVHILGTLTTPKLSASSTGNVLDHSILYKLEAMKQHLEDLKARLRRVKDLMAVTMRTTGEQAVTGKLNFKSASFNCELGQGCEVGSIAANYLNNDDISDLRNKVVPLDESVHLNGFLEFENLIIENNANVQGLIAGVNISHLVTLSGEHIITAPKIFKSVLVNDMTVLGTVGGIDVSSQTVLMNYGDQTILAEVDFDEIEVETLEVAGTVNQLHLDEVVEDLVLIGEKHVITGTKTVKGPLYMDNLDLDPEAIVNGVSLRNLWDNAFWKDSAQDIQVPMNFSQLHLVNPEVNHINGISLASPDIVKVTANVRVPSSKTFTSPNNRINQLEVLNSINGINTLYDPHSDWPNQLDMLVKSKVQTLRGLNYLPSLHLSGDSTLRGRVNDIDLAELVSNMVNKNKSQTLSGDWKFNQVEFRGPVEVHGKVDGLEVDQLLSRALKIDQPLPSTATVVFKGFVHADKIESPEISGLDIVNDFVLKNFDNVISGIKSFAAVDLLVDSQLNGLVNGVHLSFLDDSLMKSGDQRAIGKKIIKGDLIVNDLFLGKDINGVPFDKIVLTNKDITIDGPVTITGPLYVTGGIKADSLKVKGLSNGVTTQSIVDDTMLYSAHQTVFGNLFFPDNLTLAPGSDILTDNLNGISLRALADDVIYRDFPRLITGKKTFLGLVKADQLNVHGSIDGVNSWDMSHNWLLHDIPQTFMGDAFFDGDVKARSAVTAPLVNGLDLNQLEREVVKLDEPNILVGQYHMQEIIIKGAMSITGKIQGIDISEEAARRTANNVFRGRKHFATQLEIGQLGVAGTVQGVLLSDLCEKTLRKNTVQHVNNLTVNGDVFVEDNVSIGGLMSGIDLVQFNRSVLKVNQAAEINIPVYFDELVLEEEVYIDGLMSGIDIKALQETYLSLSKEQTVAAEVTFEAPIIVENNVVCESITTTDNRFQELNLEEISQTVLRTYGDQIVHAPMHFQGDLRILGDLSVAKHVSGYNVPDDLVLKTRENVIMGPVVFSQNLTIQGDLIMAEGATVQNVDISQWAENAVYKEGRFYVTGLKVFDELSVIDARAYQLVSGVNISASTLFLSEGDQVINTGATFAKPLKAECNTLVEGAVNGVLLEEFSQSVVLRDHPNIIKGRTTFATDLTIQRLVTEARIDNVNVTILIDSMEEPLREYAVVQDLVEKRRLQLKHVNQELYNPTLKLLYYKQSQVIRSSDVITWSEGTATDSQSYLFMSDGIVQTDGCTSLQVFFYNPASSGFDTTTAIPSSFAVDVETFQFNSHFFISVANVNLHSKCHTVTDGLQLFSRSQASGRFQLVSNLYPSIGVIDAALMTLNGDQFCVAAVIPDLVDIWCFRDPTSELKVKQSLRIAGVKFVTSMSTEVGTFLATFSSEISLVEVFYWNIVTDKFEILNQISSLGVGLIKMIHYPNRFDPISLLLISENRGADSILKVYRYIHAEKRFFLKVQKLHFGGSVLSVHWVTYPSNSFFLFVLSKESEHNLRVYKWNGAAGFVLKEELLVQGANRMTAIRPGGSENHYLAVSGKICAANWWEKEDSFALLLKSQMKGAY